MARAVEGLHDLPALAVVDVGGDEQLRFYVLPCCFCCCCCCTAAAATGDLHTHPAASQSGEGRQPVRVFVYCEYVLAVRIDAHLEGHVFAPRRAEAKEGLGRGGGSSSATSSATSTADTGISRCYDRFPWRLEGIRDCCSRGDWRS